MSGIANFPDSPQQAESDTHPVRSCYVRGSSLPPLGILVVCRTRPLWHRTPPEDRPDPSVLRLDGDPESEVRLYRVYGHESQCAESGSDPLGGRWEFFGVVEAADLSAWSRLQAQLESPEMGRYFDWDITAFGRRTL